MDDLNPQQLAEFRRDLLELRRSLNEAVSLAREGARTVELDQPIGRLSRMDAIQNQQIAKAGLRNQQIRVRQVEAALAALERDEYGICTRCELMIPYRRLKARPESPLCLECAEELEQKRS
jgi:DnaK suppressor protein